MVVNAIPMAAGAEPRTNEMHFTYASPGTAEFYRKNGRFADGTVLVKEGLATSHAQMTTGDANWANGTAGASSRLAIIDAVRADLGRGPVAECVGCHIANVAKTDMTWVQFYPLLRDKPGY
jgi:hypothetical protein